MIKNIKKSVLFLVLGLGLVVATTDFSAIEPTKEQYFAAFAVLNKIIPGKIAVLDYMFMQHGVIFNQVAGEPYRSESEIKTLFEGNKRLLHGFMQSLKNTTLSNQTYELAVYKMLPAFIAHSLFEALLEAWPRIWKTDLKRPGLRGFSKNLLERVACCREYEAFDCLALKIIFKLAVCSLMFCLSTSNWSCNRAGEGGSAFLLAWCCYQWSTIAIGLACKAKEKIFGRKKDPFYTNQPTVGQFLIKVEILFFGLYYLWEYFSVSLEAQRNLKILEAALNNAPAA